MYNRIIKSNHISKDGYLCPCLKYHLHTRFIYFYKYFDFQNTHEQLKNQIYVNFL